MNQNPARQTYQLPDWMDKDPQRRDMYRRMEELLNEKQRDALGEQNNIRNANWRVRSINMRMRWEKAPFDALYTHYIAATDTVVLFLIYKDAPITLTDEAPLFPSDTLVTQLRLLTS